MCNMKSIQMNLSNKCSWCFCHLNRDLPIYHLFLLIEWYRDIKDPISSLIWTQCLSVQFSQLCLTLWPHGLQHTKLPCPSPTAEACSKSYPSSQWCHPTISSPVIPFSSCLQSFPASGSFPMNQFFTSGGQRRSKTSSVKNQPEVYLFTI